MSQRRRYGEDLSYAEAHRNALPELYGRIAHRFHVADRDWTEVCCGCRAPLMLVEEHRDVGQDLGDKGTSITRNLARRAGVEAWQMAWKTNRAPDVQHEIDRHNSVLRDLEQRYPITGFTVRQLHPKSTPFTNLTPDQWWAWIALRHRSHHGICHTARRVDGVVNPVWDRFYPALHDHPLHNGELWLGAQDILKGAA